MPINPSIPPETRREPPWTVGLRAARANLVPGLIVQLLTLAVVLGYYFYPPTRGWLDGLAEIKARWSYGYTAVATIVAGAVIPELLRIFVFQKGRIRRINASNLLFTVPFWCVMGVIVDFFYRCQAVWFGAEVTFAIVAKKVLVDQLLYTPLFASPVTAWVYDWKNQGFRSHGMARVFTAAYYRETIFPRVVAAWGVWIPVVSILYSLPTLLQIPLFVLALSLWVMLYTWMSEQETA